MGGICAKTNDSFNSFNGLRQVAERYDGQCEWLNDEKFLRDLEEDSVDTELLDDEIRSLQSRESKAWRARLLKWIERSPFQIVMCLLVMLDAAVVIGEILLDLHAVKSQSHQVTADLMITVNFIKHNHQGALGGYQGNDVAYIIQLLNNNVNRTTPTDDVMNNKEIIHNDDVIDSYADSYDDDVIDTHSHSERRKRNSPVSWVPEPLRGIFKQSSESRRSSHISSQQNNSYIGLPSILVQKIEENISAKKKKVPTATLR